MSVPILDHSAPRLPIRGGVSKKKVFITDGQFEHFLFPILFFKSVDSYQL